MWSFHIFIRIKPRSLTKNFSAFSLLRRIFALPPIYPRPEYNAERLCVRERLLSRLRKNETGKHVHADLSIMILFQVKHSVLIANEPAERRREAGEAAAL